MTTRRVIREFLAPDRRKLLVVALVGVVVWGGGIQSYAFGDDMPGVVKPRLYDALRPLDVWTPSVLLLAPALLTYEGLAVETQGRLHAHPYVYGAMLVTYVYLLSCLFIFAHDRWGRAARRSSRILLVGVALVFLWVIGSGGLALPPALPSMREALAAVISSSVTCLVILAFVYLLLALAIGVYRAVPAAARRSLGGDRPA